MFKEEVWALEPERIETFSFIIGRFMPLRMVTGSVIAELP